MRKSANRDMIRVVMDIPATTTLSLFNNVSAMLKAENVETRPIGSPAKEGEAPTRKSGANMREVLLWHFQRRQKLARTELQNILQISGFSPDSLAAALAPMIDDKLVKSAGRGTYEFKQLALPAPRK